MAKRRADGEGSIRKRKDGRWESRVVIGYSHSGEPIRKSFYGTSQKEVIEKMKGYRITDISKMTFYEWCKTYVDVYKKPEVKSSTYVTYKNALDNMIKPSLIAGVKLQSLEHHMLQAFLNSLSDHARSYIIQARVLVVGALKRAKQMGYVDPRVYDDLKTPKGRVQEKKEALTDEEWMKLTAYLEANYSLDTLALLTGAWTGLRIGEVLGLKWSDVNLSNGTISVRRTLIYLPGIGYVEQEPKTEGSARIVPMNEKLVQLLDAHSLEQKKLLLILEGKSAKLKEQYVFAQDGGLPRAQKTVNRTLSLICEELKIKTITFHELRHTFVTRLIRLYGVDPKTVAELVGHSTLDMTLKVYTSISDDDKKNAIRALTGVN